MANITGLRLCVLKWLDVENESKGSILLLHGLHQHMMSGFGNADLLHTYKYAGFIIDKCIQLGFIVYSADFQSFCLSDGITKKRVFFKSFDDIVDAMKQLLGIVKRTQPKRGPGH